MDAIRRRARKLVRKGKSDLLHPAKNNARLLSTSAAAHTSSLIILQSTSSLDPIRAVAPHPGHGPSLQTGENGTPVVAENTVGHTNNSSPAQQPTATSERNASGQQGAHAPTEYIASSILGVTGAPPQISTPKTTRYMKLNLPQSFISQVAASNTTKCSKWQLRSWLPTLTNQNENSS
jgi:hypothetical protein